MIPTSKRGQIHKYLFDPDNYEYEFVFIENSNLHWIVKRKKHTPTSNYWTSLKKYSDKSDRRYLENKLRLIDTDSEIVLWKDWTGWWMGLFWKLNHQDPIIRHFPLTNIQAQDLSQSWYLSLTLLTFKIYLGQWRNFS